MVTTYVKSQIRAANLSLTVPVNSFDSSLQLTKIILHKNVTEKPKLSRETTLYLFVSALRRYNPLKRLYSTQNMDGLRTIPSH